MIPAHLKAAYDYANDCADDHNQARFSCEWVKTVIERIGELEVLIEAALRQEEARGGLGTDLLWRMKQAVRR